MSAQSWLLELVDPVSGTPLRPEGMCNTVDDLLEGNLVGSSGRYPVKTGIPRFTDTSGEVAQEQTARSFGYKWRERHTYDSPAVLAVVRDWLTKKYGFESPEAMRSFFASRRRILDAGCGSGLSSSTWLDRDWPEAWEGEWYGVDISTAVDVARDRLGNIRGTRFVQADLMQLPFRPRFFDTIFSEGVLHHTRSTEEALRSLVPLLAEDGVFLFYVYRRKGPVREFTDDYIRSQISGLPPEEGWESLRSLTRLGQALAELKCEVEVSEEVPLLGIKRGRHDVQRLIYWHFAKLFWNPQLSFEENLHVNFDWYHPAYAHRQTEEEVRGWCRANGLRIQWFCAEESGISVRAVKE
jgi:SAM-dependent methyltransferase